MRQIVIVGNSGAARECHAMLRDIWRARPETELLYTFRGFLSWKGYPGNLKQLADRYLGDADTYSISPEDIFIIGIADPVLRHAVYQFFKMRGADFLTLIHPWSEISLDACIGEGNIFQRGSIVASGSIIGHANYFNGAVHLAADTVVGDCNFVGPGTLLLEKSRIGDRNSLGVRTILQAGSCVGNGNLVAPGSVVHGTCGNMCRMAGNPAVLLECLTD